VSDDGGPKMLRMVRYKSILQDAERLRNPLGQDWFECLARMIHMGDARHAHEALVDWLEYEATRLLHNPRSTPHERITLWATFTEMESKIDGRQGVMSTELGYYSQNVSPDFGKVIHDFAEWCTKNTLNRMFDEGHEVVLQGHVGTGKTHLAVKFLELLLRITSPQYVVLTNINGIHDKAGNSPNRVHHVTRLSEVLRIWAELPPGTRIVLVIDEPESNLRGGASKSVRVFQDFRYMIRKLGMAKLEIWHSTAEIYKALREDDSEQVYRMVKDDKSSFELTRNVRGESVVRRIDNVPDLVDLTFATYAAASMVVDVSMQVILDRIAKLWIAQDMKREVLAALNDKGTYLEDYQDDAKTPAAAPKPDEMPKIEDAVAKVLANPAEYRGARAAYSVAKIRAAFHLTLRQAQFVAELCKQRAKPHA
jgi:energy-coupling factor transporter ATP-binding protein EcfA2